MVVSHNEHFIAGHFRQRGRTLRLARSLANKLWMVAEHMGRRLPYQPNFLREQVEKLIAHLRCGCRLNCEWNA